MFKIGTRVQVVDEEEARRTGANVHKGDKGTVVNYSSPDYPVVAIDGMLTGGYPWSIPIKGLRRIHTTRRLQYELERFPNR